MSGKILIVDDTESIVHPRTESQFISTERWYCDCEDNELLSILQQIKYRFNIQQIQSKMQQR